MTENEEIKDLDAIVEQYKVQACSGCAFWGEKSWDMLCKECRVQEKLQRLLEKTGRHWKLQ